MIQSFFIACSIFPALALGSIDGKGLLCTCVEERAIRVLPKPEIPTDNAITSEMLTHQLMKQRGHDVWRPLSCADEMSAYYAKYPLTGNPDDVDIFLTFSDGQVRQEVLTRTNDNFDYVVIGWKDFVYSTTIEYISWADQFESHKVGRKSLQMVRQWHDGDIAEVSQCKLFPSIDELEAAKNKYKRQYEQKFKQQMEARGNQL